MPGARLLPGTHHRAGVKQVLKLRKMSSYKSHYRGSAGFAKSRENRDTQVVRAQSVNEYKNEDVTHL